MQFEITFTNRTGAQKNFFSRSMTHFQYRNDVLFFDFCVNQPYGDESVSNRSLIKSAYSVICNVDVALFKLFYVCDCRKSYHGKFAFSKNSC